MIYLSRIYSSMLSSSHKKHLNSLAKRENVTLEKYLLQIILKHLFEIEKDIPPIPEQTGDSVDEKKKTVLKILEFKE